MAGLLTDVSEKVVPACKYGHGALVMMQSHDGNQYFMSPVAEAMTGTFSGSRVHVAPSAFVYSVFKCPKCSYLELHDTSAGGT